MNKLLIDGLDGVNNLLAILIIAVGGMAGYVQGNMSDTVFIATLLGLAVGLIAACVICGLLATLLQIEKHLRKIAAAEPRSPLQ